MFTQKSASKNHSGSTLEFSSHSKVKYFFPKGMEVPLNAVIALKKKKKKQYTLYFVRYIIFFILASAPFLFLYFQVY